MALQPPNYMRHVVNLGYGVSIGSIPTPPAESPLYIEEGRLELPTGISTINVLFDTEKVSDNYVFDNLYIENTADISALWLIPIPRQKDRSGFTCEFNGETDSTNYVLYWKVRVV